MLLYICAILQMGWEQNMPYKKICWGPKKEKAGVQRQCSIILSSEYTADTKQWKGTWKKQHSSGKLLQFVVAALMQ